MLQFFENVVSLVTLKAIDLVLAVFLIPFLIYKVGVENYGRYAFAVALVLFFVNIANYGFELTAVRSIAKHQGETVKINELINEVFTVKLYLTIVLFVVLLCVIMVIPTYKDDADLYLFASVLLVADLFSLRWFFMGIEQVKFWTFINLSATCCYVVLVLFWVTTPIHYYRIALFEGVGFLLVNVLSFIGVLYYFKIRLSLISFKKVMRYLVKNWSSFNNLFIPSMTSNTAVFLVGVFGVPTHVSIMQLGVKVANAFSTVNTILTKLFYAMVNRKIQLFRQSVWVIISIGFAMAVFMFLSAPILIKHWLTITASETEQLLFITKLLSPTPLLMAIISAYGINGLLVFGKDVLFGKVTLFSAILGLAVGLFVIPNYTVIGGALFLLFTRGVYAMGSLLLFRKSLVLKIKSKRL